MFVVCPSDSSCLFWFGSQYSPLVFSPPVSTKLPILAGEYFSAPSGPKYQYKSVIAGANVNEQISTHTHTHKKTKPGTSLWCEIGHLKGINDGSFQHNCLIMPGRWGTALTRTHCATSLDSPQQKANQYDSLFSSEWEGEWKKENGERRRRAGNWVCHRAIPPLDMLPQKQMNGVNTARITAPGRRITAV